ncbi:VWA domain-containing protein [Ectothiorhodospiraceae bacterium BW-2]|nr:VWA domain-containing protein [Ectothiorhodospiraceae bacterium BW-2]
MAIVSLLPLLIYGWLPPVRTEASVALRVPFLGQMAVVEQSQQLWVGRSDYWRRGVALCGWLALVIAAMRPQWLGEAQQYPATGRDLLLAIDLSGSMEVEDFQLSGRMIDRLSATKGVAGEFIERRYGDRVGLILFGSRPYVQAPLTFDRQTVVTLLDEAVIGMAGDQTAIGDAIGLAIKRLEASRQAGKPVIPVLILMTDGANTAGVVSPLQAATVAAEKGLTIYTIGIGADRLQVRTLFGTQTINPSRDLDEKTLRRIAELTGGRYFRARDSGELEQIYQLLDELEPVARDAFNFRPRRELFYWPLALALLLLGVATLLRHRFSREVAL